jgi:hypothetical protein
MAHIFVFIRNIHIFVQNRALCRTFLQSFNKLKSEEKS